MSFGNKPVDGGNLILSGSDLKTLDLSPSQTKTFVKKFYGSEEIINGKMRFCLWINDDDLVEATSIAVIKNRIQRVREIRLKSRDKGANQMAVRAHQFREMY